MNKFQRSLHGVELYHDLSYILNVWVGRVEGGYTIDLVLGRD